MKINEHLVRVKVMAITAGKTKIARITAVAPTAVDMRV
jgi:hypothetical protein